MPSCQPGACRGAALPGSLDREGSGLPEVPEGSCSELGAPGLDLLWATRGLALSPLWAHSGSGSELRLSLAWGQGSTWAQFLPIPLTRWTQALLGPSCLSPAQAVVSALCCRTGPWALSRERGQLPRGQPRSTAQALPTRSPSGTPPSSPRV